MRDFIKYSGTFYERFIDYQFKYVVYVEKKLRERRRENSP